MDDLVERSDAPSILAGLFLEHVLDAPESLLDALPVGVYFCDAAGLIVRYNRKAAELWGRRPVHRDPAERYCGSYRLHRPEGGLLPHAECPVAWALATGNAALGQDVVIERPDGSRIRALVDIEPIKDDAGRVIGAVNVFRAAPQRPHHALRMGEESLTGDSSIPAPISAPMAAIEASVEVRALQELAAIVESSDDAILSKDLNGIVRSWNRGAERLFGYTAEEMVGRPVTLLMPPELQHEGPSILARIRRGERVDHYETVRRRKNGALVDISLTVSPIRDAEGRIIGASKIARDITGRKRAEEQQQLLLGEMTHRVKNLLTLAASIVSLSARSATTVQDLAADVQERLSALARAQDLVLRSQPGTSPRLVQSISLHSLIRAVLAPFDDPEDADGDRIAVTGSDLVLGAGGHVNGLALLLHEFATNAAKYGSLSSTEGRVHVHCEEDDDRFVMTWQERGGPPVAQERGDEGFGTFLTRATIKGQLAGEMTRDWKPDGLQIRLSVSRRRLTA